MQNKYTRVTMVFYTFYYKFILTLIAVISGKTKLKLYTLVTTNKCVAIFLRIKYTL